MKKYIVVNGEGMFRAAFERLEDAIEMCRKSDGLWIVYPEEVEQ